MYRTLRGMCALIATAAWRAAVMICLPVATVNAAEEAADSAPLPPVAPPVYMYMLTNEKICEELALSPEQRVTVGNLHQEFIRVSPAFRRTAQTPRGVEGDASAEVLHAAAVKRSTDFESRATRILSVKQVARLEQLRLQARGYWVVLEPSVQQEVGISQDQIDAARNGINACGVDSQQVAQQVNGGKMTAEQAATEIDRIVLAAHKRIIALLSDTQQQDLQTLLGPRPAFDPGKLRFRLSSKPAGK